MNKEKIIDLLCHGHSCEDCGKLIKVRMEKSLKYDCCKKSKEKNICEEWEKISFSQKTIKMIIEWQRKNNDK